MTISFSGQFTAPPGPSGDNLKTLVCVTVARASTAWAHKRLDLSRLFGRPAKWLIENCEPLKHRYLSEWSKGYFFPIGTAPYEIAAATLSALRPAGKAQETKEGTVIHPDGNLSLTKNGDGHIWIPSTGELEGEWVRIYSTEKATRNRTLLNKYANGNLVRIGDCIKLKQTAGWLNTLVARPLRGQIIHAANGSALIQWEGEEKQHYLLASIFPCEELLPFDVVDTSLLSPAQVRVYEGIVSGEYSFEKRWHKERQLIIHGKTVPLSILNALMHKKLLPDAFVTEAFRFPPSDAAKCGV